MNEIRFNSPNTQVEETPKIPEETRALSKKNNTFGPKLKKYLKVFFIIVAAVVLVAVLFPMFKSKVMPKIFGGGKTQYAAVFLTNGQVYFGQMRSTSKTEIILENVYYLQANQNGTATSNETLGSSFQLVKLGNELHGPTDELYINKAQVVFYEYLRDDSKVVESINKR